MCDGRECWLVASLSFSVGFFFFFFFFSESPLLPCCSRILGRSRGFGESRKINSGRENDGESRAYILDRPKATFCPAPPPSLPDTSLP